MSRRSSPGATRRATTPVRRRINGVCYATREWGAGPPLLLLHGFTGCAALWEPHAVYWSAQFRVIGLDLLGHGDSDAPADAARYAMPHALADLAALLDALDLPSCALLGYSMGGRLALAFAVEHGERVHALVLEGASAGIEDPRQRAARQRADAALAARIERDGVAAFVDAWMAQPLFASQAALGPATRAAARAQRLANSARGLANTLRGLGSGAQPSYWHRLDRLTAPTLLLVGERDATFRARAAALRARLPTAQLEIIPTAGHATHLETPEAFRARVRAFLSHAGAGRPGAGRSAPAAPAHSRPFRAARS